MPEVLVVFGFLNYLHAASGRSLLWPYDKYDANILARFSYGNCCRSSPAYGNYVITQANPGKQFC